MVQTTVDITEPPFTPIDRATYEPIKDKLPNSLFTKNRARFFKLFKERIQGGDAGRAVALFKGATAVPLYSSDVNYPEY